MKQGIAITLLSLSCLPGCVGIGPGELERDNLAYGQALGDAWQQQMLLNIVKLRYGESPAFLEVASVINQYSVEGQVGVSAPSWDRPAIAGPPVASVSGRWADRPTITYTPVLGDQFTRSLLTPIRPAALAAMMQSGWPAEFVFGVTVRSINGLSNGTRSALMRDEPDPRFGQLVRDLSAIQRSGHVGIRVERRPDGNAVVLVMAREEPNAIDDVRSRVRRALGLPEGTSEFNLIYGMLPGANNEVAVLSRSVLEILGEFSFGVDVPPEHVVEGRVLAAPDFQGTWVPPTIHIHSGPDRPTDAAVAVPYRKLWFWIDDCDIDSKRHFSFALILVSLAESGDGGEAPLVTVGT